jgi:hypothetical protein
MKVFRANGYKIYSVTGGGQDFVRVYAGLGEGVTMTMLPGWSPRSRFVGQ